MINLETLPAPEAERLAYAEGYTGTAALFARIADLEAECERHLDQIQELEDEAGALLAALYVALPYVEDVLADPAQLACFKPGVVQQHLRQINDALGEQ